MKAKLEKILRKKYPHHTPEQLAYEVNRRMPTEPEVVEQEIMDTLAAIVTVDPIVLQEPASGPVEATAFTPEIATELAKLADQNVENPDEDEHLVNDGLDNDCDIDPYEDDMTAAPTTPGTEEPEATTEVAEPDDLTKIKGIGKKLQVKLSELGITTFQEIADLTPDEVDKINDQLDFKGRVTFEEWITQAAEFVS